MVLIRIPEDQMTSDCSFFFFIEKLIFHDSHNIISWLCVTERPGDRVISDSDFRSQGPGLELRW